MNTYEFFTINEKITFEAENNKIAFCCALILGNGLAACKNKINNEDIPSFLIFAADKDIITENYLGENLDIFIKKNKLKISQSFDSFYCIPGKNKEYYDNIIKNLKTHKELKKFKKQNKDKITLFCAWHFAEKFRK